MAEKTGRDILLSSFKFGSKVLRNRIVMAPMTRSKSPNGIPTDDVVRYYRSRAEGECGLIITEGTVVGHKASNGYPDVPQFFGDESLAGWKRVVDAVHEVGGAIIPQIWHVGSVRKKGMQPDPEIPGYAPSAVPHPGDEKKSETPVAMTHKDIDEVVAAFADSARSAKELGFDGVEIHGAHGYLIDQFFWDKTNQRTDEYGGFMEKRGRMAKEIISAVREAVGREFPVVLRFSQWKMGDYGAKLAANPQELESFLTPLVDAGVDIFHCSTRRYWEPEFEGSGLNLAGWTKKITGKATITVGSVGLDNEFIKTFGGEASKRTGLDKLFEMMERDEFDLVAIGRMYLCDPLIAKKIREGKDSEIVEFSHDCMQKLV